MDLSKFGAALEAAANAYAQRRRTAAALPLQTSEIVALLAREALIDEVLPVERRETARRGRLRACRTQSEVGDLEAIVMGLGSEQLERLRSRTARELATLRRRARNRDQRYDINRHAALARLSAAIRTADGAGGPADAGEPSPVHEKRTPGRCRAPFESKRHRLPVR
ncbi:hypothetical protein DYI37_04980 [Fulvimarina endophytica]|uniref:Uncharacterized protein n=1 Tax=Fulvimarina endophytica TaxID=2293836 RepID=A0A371X7J2_9HYPH|nr:hypothetical protein [Fulvimarina endophytica]RFC65202.1 hypothetical protein DYI37_04980 [Fulvimarina endophytica]